MKLDDLDARLKEIDNIEELWKVLLSGLQEIEPEDIIGMNLVLMTDDPVEDHATALTVGVSPGDGTNSAELMTVMHESLDVQMKEFARKAAEEIKDSLVNGTPPPKNGFYHTIQSLSVMKFLQDANPGIEN